jgi:DNA polymerase III subunit beta
MEFTVSKADLVRELGFSQGVVEKKTTVPILSNVLLEAADGQLTLTATDLELSVKCSTAAKIGKAGAGTIPAKRLMDYVRLLPDGDVTIKFSETHWANITSGRSKTKLAGMAKDSYPELPEMPELMAELPAKQFSKLIARVIFAISVEESRFTLNGALLILKGSNITMVTTDGHRLAMTQGSVEGATFPDFKAIVPRKALAELLKLCSDAADDAKISFSGDDNHLYFAVGTRLLISRKLSGNFPDFERVLPKEQPYVLTFARDEFKSALERVAQFADERSRAIRMSLNAGELKIYSTLTDTGESEEPLSTDYDGPTIEIGFNAQYLLEFLRGLPETEINLLFKDGQSAGELRPNPLPENGTYRYVVMPMRI